MKKPKFIVSFEVTTLPGDPPTTAKEVKRDFKFLNDHYAFKFSNVTVIEKE